MSGCKWVATDQPRVIGGRHLETCQDDACKGCQPCTTPHCRVCAREHVDANGTCAGCLDEVRTNLAEIVRMCRSLPEEVEHRGVDGEAMNLLGPVADPEAWGHRQASARVGRIDRAWLEDATDARHPLLVLATWEDVFREALEHETDKRATVEAAAGYLGDQLTYMAGYEDVPFEDFARDLRQCVSHMERVLHDGEQVDRGAPCMTCSTPLQRVWAEDGKRDGWECRRCHQSSTEDQYRFAVAHLHREEATHLTDRDMEIRTGVKAGTVRVWAQRGLIDRRRDSGRTVYEVAQVEATARERGLLAS